MYVGYFSADLMLPLPCECRLGAIPPVCSLSCIETMSVVSACNLNSPVGAM